MTQRDNDCVEVFLLLFRKGMFGLKLKKKKNKAEKGLILANKAAQGEALVGWGGGELTATLGAGSLTEWTPPWLRMGFALHRSEAGHAACWIFGPCRSQVRAQDRPPQDGWSPGHWTKRAGGHHWAGEGKPRRSSSWTQAPASVPICSVAQDKPLSSSESRFLPLSSGHGVGCWVDLTWPYGESSEIENESEYSICYGVGSVCIVSFNPSIILPVGVFVLVLQRSLQRCRKSEVWGRPAAGICRAQ